MCRHCQVLEGEIQDQVCTLPCWHGSSSANQCPREMAQRGGQSYMCNHSLWHGDRQAWCGTCFQHFVSKYLYLLWSFYLCEFCPDNIFTLQRFVIHNTLSKSIESYYQESGRAGRDDLPAHCIVLYQKKDFSRIVCMLRNGGNFRSAMEQAKKMQAYCELKVNLRFKHFFFLKKKSRVQCITSSKVLCKTEQYVSDDFPFSADWMQEAGTPGALWWAVQPAKVQRWPKPLWQLPQDIVWEQYIVCDALWYFKLVNCVSHSHMT